MRANEEPEVEGRWMGIVPRIAILGVADWTEEDRSMIQAQVSIGEMDTE